MNTIDYKNIEAVFSELEPFGAKCNVPLSEHTSFRIGGPADIFMIPRNEEELFRALECAEKHALPVFVMGNGSNLLISDSGIRGLVIKIRSQEADISINSETKIMTASASALLSVAVKKSVDAGFSGLEWAAGIPGTVGGAVSMNAGAYGSEIKNTLRSVRAVVKTDNKYEIADKAVKDSDLGYRYSRFSYPDMIVLSATFELSSGDGTEKMRMDDYTKRRASKQPLSYPSAGSVFKRPDGFFAGKLIEDAGLKGVSVGGAKVSELHAGFIINTGGAKASDVVRLIEIIKKAVFESSGVMLEEELKLIGG